MRKVYTRPIGPLGEIARALLLLAWVLITLPIKLLFAVLSGLLGGAYTGHKGLQPTKKRFE
jgi:hypothetical protein